MPRRRSHQRRPDRGATMVEFAFILPVLALFTFGVLEVGMIMRSQAQTVAASQAGARTASHLGKERLADYSAITGALAALPQDDQIQAIVVFKPDSTGAMPTACKTSSQNGTCNRFDRTFLDSLVSAENATAGSGSAFFGGVTSCTGAAPDRYWCPTTRKTKQATGLDSVGVRVEFKHRTLTNLFGKTHDIAEQSISRMEPEQITR
ncbi:MAG: pilus assembly protein [Microthrixaceae bacterium]